MSVIVTDFTQTFLLQMLKITANALKNPAKAAIVAGEESYN